MTRPVFALLLAVLMTGPLAAAEVVDIQLTYPNGKSPKVFTSGWTFGAKAVQDLGKQGKKDISNQVRWSGSGSFSPSVGAVSRPRFNGAGSNSIVLSVKIGKQTITKKFAVQAVSPARYAKVGDHVFCRADAHGCPACPHPVKGVIATGSSKVLINGKPAARVGDTGKHAACCGPNTFKIAAGDPEVLIEGKPAARYGDETRHCGGVGNITQAAVEIGSKFAGTFAGTANGKADFAINGTQIAGTFKGSHSSEGGGVGTLSLKGTYNARTGVASGSLSGTATYVGLNNKTATARVSGTFSGRTSGNTLKGTWKGTATGITSMKVSGTFSTTRAAK